MHIFRYRDPQGAVHYGARQGDAVLEIEGDLLGAFRVTERPAQVALVLAPFVPTVVLCVGLNYRRHAEEMGSPIPQYPVMFMKNLAALQRPLGPIEIPVHLPSDQVDFEGELAIVIGKEAKNVPKARALDYVLGYTCANDVSARDWQKDKSGGQYCRGKSFDTFLPLGPVIVTADEIPDPNQLRLVTTLNGEVMQDSPTSDMIFDVPTLIEFLSGSTTLLPGTVILTGTPSGVGMGRNPQRWLKSGDTVAVEIAPIGRLINPVAFEGEAVNV